MNDLINANMTVFFGSFHHSECAHGCLYDGQTLSKVEPRSRPNYILMNSITMSTIVTHVTLAASVPLPLPVVNWSL